MEFVKKKLNFVQKIREGFSRGAGGPGKAAAPPSEPEPTKRLQRPSKQRARGIRTLPRLDGRDELEDGAGQGRGPRPLVVALDVDVDGDSQPSAASASSEEEGAPELPELRPPSRSSDSSCRAPSPPPPDRRLSVSAGPPFGLGRRRRRPSLPADGEDTEFEFEEAGAARASPASASRASPPAPSRSSAGPHSWTLTVPPRPSADLEGCARRGAGGRWGGRSSRGGREERTAGRGCAGPRLRALRGLPLRPAPGAHAAVAGPAWRMADARALAAGNWLSDAGRERHGMTRAAFEGGLVVVARAVAEEMGRRGLAPALRLIAAEHGLPACPASLALLALAARITTAGPRGLGGLFPWPAASATCKGPRDRQWAPAAGPATDREPGVALRPWHEVEFNACSLAAIAELLGPPPRSARPATLPRLAIDRDVDRPREGTSASTREPLAASVDADSPGGAALQKRALQNRLSALFEGRRP
eukprot:tig00020681_g12835.t1